MRISDWSSDVCSSDLPPAPRRGGQERGVGLDQDPVGRGEGQGLAQRIRVLERDRSREREVRTAVQALAGEGCVTGEAVHHPTLRGSLLVEDAEHVIVGVAIVDHQERKSVGRERVWQYV